MRKYKLVVQLRRFGVVLSGLSELVHDKQNLKEEVNPTETKVVFVRTLPTMIINIRIVRILLDSGIETLESFPGVPLLHMNTCYFDQTLCERRQNLDRLLEVRLCLVDIASKEPKTRYLESIRYRL